jgi:hypothetical protein
MYAGNKIIKQPGMEVHACNPSTRGSTTSLEYTASSRLAWKTLDRIEVLQHKWCRVQAKLKELDG